MQYIVQNLQNIWQKQNNEKAYTASFCNPYVPANAWKFLFFIVPFFGTHFLHLFSLLSDPLPLCHHLRISGLNRSMMFVMTLSCKIFNIWSYLVPFDYCLSFLLFFPLFYFSFPCCNSSFAFLVFTVLSLDLAGDHLIKVFYLPCLGIRKKIHYMMPNIQ